MLIASVCIGADSSHGRAHHVVVIVWDGMRPDFVTEKTTPNLWKLAQGGVTFLHHHPVYTSSTEVNGTAMATGVYPERSGIMANREYRPEIDPHGTVAMEVPSTIAATAGDYVAVPSVVQMLHAAGRTAAVAGSKGVALLQDWSHNGKTSAAQKSVIFFDGQAFPPAAMALMTGTLGAWPETIEFPNIPQDIWTTRALTEVLWKDEVPAYSMLWMSDPDYSQHQMAPGSEMALAALKSVDDRLETVLQALDAKGARNDTDIMVVSDHGFSTIQRASDVLTPLTTAGIRVTGSFAGQPQPGDVLASGNGGSVMFYITGHDKEIGRQLVEAIQKTDYAGVIFSRWSLPGTFSLKAAHIATKEAPDVVVALHWTAQPNRFGAAGMLDGDWLRKAGKGTHASLSAYDMHNTLIAAGPDFKPGYRDEIPSGNIDIAPTVLWILGVQQAVPMDGRVLAEALSSYQGPLETNPMVIHEREVADNKANGWQQYLQISRVGHAEYIDEGNRGAAMLISGTASMPQTTGAR